MDISSIYITVSLILGLLLVLPYLHLAARVNPIRQNWLLGSGLFIAALIYVGFARYHANETWMTVEWVGVGIYGAFFCLGISHSSLWLALGWLTHSLWDLVLHLMGPGHQIVPPWYAIACLAFDLPVAAYILRQTLSGARMSTTQEFEDGCEASSASQAIENQTAKKPVWNRQARQQHIACKRNASQL